jgi:hypothetical protein
MLSQEENERLTRVGPGTPCGELLRPYDLEGWTSQHKLRVGQMAGQGLTRPRSWGEVFDERHAAFDVPYGAARPASGERGTPSARPLPR